VGSLAGPLIDRIESRSAIVGVVGLGYVGLPVAVAFAEAGFTVAAVDVDASKVRGIQAGRSHLLDVSGEQVSRMRKSGRLRASTAFRILREADAVIVCVPTPLQNAVPDLSSVVASGTSIARVLKRGALVVLESTSYPGTTEELLAPLLEQSGLVAGRDFMLAYSPERIDPGNPTFGFTDIPKVVGGIDGDSTKAASTLYGQVVAKVVAVSGTKEAELAKLIENTFRHVNIALINELTMYAHEMEVDIWEAIEAASTKPFGFAPFWPGPGWGGHCIPLDPAYLSWRVRRDRDHDIRFVELAHSINAEMPRYVVERVGLLLNDNGRAVRGARILGIGVAYKAGTGDLRGSAGVKVLEALMRRGAEVSYHDPLVPELVLGGRAISSIPLDGHALGAQDLVISLVPQVGVDWRLITRHATLVLDCCMAFRGDRAQVTRL
jgi:UDP-N-acetyl-D-glucosamine dehydrogenase